MSLEGEAEMEETGESIRQVLWFKERRRLSAPDSSVHSSASQRHNQSDSSVHSAASQRAHGGQRARVKILHYHSFNHHLPQLHTEGRPGSTRMQADIIKTQKIQKKN